MTLHNARNSTSSEKDHGDTGEESTELNADANLPNMPVETEGNCMMKKKNYLSDFQLTFDKCFLSPLFCQNSESYTSVLGTLCSEYLAFALPSQYTEFTACPVNFRDVYGQQVDCVFCPLSPPHRKAIIAWSKYTQNSKIFFSIYALQCIFIHSFNLLLRAGACSDENVLIDKDDVSNEINSDILDKNTSRKPCKNVHYRMRRDEAYSLITKSAQRIFRTAPELFLRILCDSASCSLEIDFAENHSISNGKNTSINPFNFYSTSLQTILQILTESLEHFGGTVSMILSSALKSCNYQNAKGGKEKHPPNPGVIPIFKDVVKELESGLLASALILYFITDDLRSQEVRQLLTFNLYAEIGHLVEVTFE